MKKFFGLKGNIKKMENRFNGTNGNGYHPIDGRMTDKEKIEKLLDLLVIIGAIYECDSFFAFEERWDNRYDDDWCGQHCEWNCPHKECFRHFLLGE